MSDYLWDGTGEPDADVERLERVLGSLRYEPRELDVPLSVRVEKPHGMLFPRLAAVAAIVIVLLATAWFVTTRNRNVQQPVAIDRPVVHPQSTRVENTGVSPAPIPETVAEKGPILSSTPKRSRFNKSQRPARASRQNATVASSGLLDIISQRQQIAKEQLIYALRLTGEKLNDVQESVRVRDDEAPPVDSNNR